MVMAILLRVSKTKVADLLGYEAAVFVITGTMNQPTALEIACQEKKKPFSGYA